MSGTTDDPVQRVFLMAVLDMFLAYSRKDEDAHKRHLQLAIRLYEAYPEKVRAMAKALGATGGAA